MVQARKITATVMAPLFAASLLVAGCETKQEQGTIAGLAAGAAVGSLFGKGSGRVFAIAGGTVVGGLIGNRVGKSMDDRDKREAQAAAKKAESAHVGESVAWNNPDSGNNGTIEVVQEGKDADGNTCRDLKHTVNAGGETQTDTGVICKNAEGKWVTVEYDEED